MPERRIRGLHYHQWLENLDGIPFGAEVTNYDGTNQSFQAAYAMLGLAAAAGGSTSTSPETLAAFHAEVHGGETVDGNVATAVNLSGTANIVSAINAKYSHVGTNASTYPGAAIQAGIGNGSTAARAAVLAYMDGDTLTTSATVAFGVDWRNSIAASRFNFGLDLEGPAAHDGYFAPRYNQAFIRMGGRVQNAAGDLVTVADLVWIGGTAAPTDGTSGTGANVAGPGSKYTRQDGASSNEFIQRGTLASPTWVSVGTLS